MELQTVCLELLWLETFEVKASILSTWRPSVDASAESAGVTGWFPFRLTGLISLLHKGLSGIFSSTTIQKLNSLAFTLSYGPDSTSVHDYWKNHSFVTTDLCSKVSLCFLIHCAGFSLPFFLPRSKCVLILWLQSRSIVFLEPKKIKSATIYTFPSSVCHDVVGLDAMNVEYIFMNSFMNVDF